MKISDISPERIDDNHFKVDIPDIKRAGTYSADVYLGNDARRSYRKSKQQVRVQL